MATLPEPVQFDRIMANLQRKFSDIEQYIKLKGLRRCNESLFYRTLVGYTEEPLPPVHTPTVGDQRTCLEASADPSLVGPTLHKRGNTLAVDLVEPRKALVVIAITVSDPVVVLGRIAD